MTTRRTTTGNVDGTIDGIRTGQTSEVGKGDKGKLLGGRRVITESGGQEGHGISTGGKGSGGRSSSKVGGGGAGGGIGARTGRRGQANGKGRIRTAADPRGGGNGAASGEEATTIGRQLRTTGRNSIVSSPGHGKP